MPGFPVLSPRVCSLMSIESMMPANHLILCHPLLLLPSIFPSISIFSNEPVLPIRWPKYWSFSCSISPSNECSGWISLGLTGLISLIGDKLPDKNQEGVLGRITESLNDSQVPFGSQVFPKRPYSIPFKHCLWDNHTALLLGCESYLEMTGHA